MTRNSKNEFLALFTSPNKYTHKKTINVSNITTEIEDCQNI
jgi:hypothetical protein